MIFWRLMVLVDLSQNSWRVATSNEVLVICHDHVQLDEITCLPYGCCYSYAKINQKHCNFACVPSWKKSTYLLYEGR